MAAVKCSKCGEELLGAVNRCWRCGQVITATPDASAITASPTTAAGSQPVDAVGAKVAAADPESASDWAGQGSTSRLPARLTTADLIDARRAGMMAMGGTVTSLVLGLLATIFAIFWPPAAIIAVLGLGMGLWGLSSPRRNLALVGMLLCCLAIGIGAYGLARNISIAMQRNRAIQFDDVPAADGN